MGFLPLSSITVVDLTRALAGPFCTLLLADLGANVIKVEPLPGGDMTREWGPFIDGESTYFLSINRNKKSLALNFKEDRAKEVLIKLISKADVLVENFRPGVMDRMGFDYQQCATINPRLIYASITGFGPTGLYRERAGFDQIAQGMSGLMSITGYREGFPLRLGVPIGDIIAGMFTALGVLAAVIEREKSGKGTKVESSLLESLIGILVFQAQRFLSLGEVPKPEGNDHPTLAPYGTFEAKDGHINIAAGTQEMWKKLCAILGLDSLVEDARFIDNTQRLKNRDELKNLINEKLKGRGWREWIDILNQAGIPCGPIYNMGEVFSDPQVVHRKMVEEVEHPLLGRLPLVRFPLVFEGSLSSGRGAPPLLGQHTKEVLEGLGYSREKIKSMHDGGVVYTLSP